MVTLLYQKLGAFYVNAPIYEIILPELTGGTPIFTNDQVEYIIYNLLKVRNIFFVLKL